ncbi:MAG: hypothetical protein ABIG95_01710 [Candidatus Woesearchaeota archaeon]
MADDYDLLPHKEIMRLRKEVQELRTALADKSTRTSPKNDDLVSSVKQLTVSIDNLMKLFEQAGSDMRAEDHVATHEHMGSMNNHLGGLNEKMDQLLKHNEEIAKGILVVAEMMKEHLPEINSNTKPIRRVMRPMPRPVQQDYNPIPNVAMPPERFVPR